MNTWRAKWIWIDQEEAHRVSAMWARTTISRSKVGNVTSIRISAAHRYRLWINGELMGTGPDRADPRFLYFDEYPLPSGNGALVIVALVYHFCADKEPPSRNWCLSDGPPGLIAEIYPSESEASYPLDWQVRRSAAWSEEAQLFSIFRGPSQDVDLARYEVELAESFSGQGEWHSPVAFAFDFKGLYPEPRPNEVPRLREEEIRPVALRRSLANLRDLTNPRRILGYAPEQPMTVKSVGDMAWLEFDFGRAFCGYPLLELEGAGEIDVLFGEAGVILRQERLKLQLGKRVRYLGLDWRGGTILSLNCSKLTAPLTIHKVAILDQVYPFYEEGRFLCDSVELNRVWQISRTTAWSGVRDHPYDCAREQALWLEDLVVHMKAMAACFGDLRPVRKGVLQALRPMTDRGIVPMPGPAGMGYGFDLSPLRWSLSPLALPQLLEGVLPWEKDRELLDWGLEKIGLMLSFYRSYEDERGLLVMNPDGKQALQRFGGWNHSIMEGVNAGVSAQYALAIRSAASIARQAGWEELAKKWEERSTSIVEAIRTAYWRSERALFIDGEKDGAYVEMVSSTVNAWCALAGALPGGREGDWARQLTRDPGILPPESPYDATLLLMAFAELDLEESVAGLLREYFGSIVRAGFKTLPEFWRSALGTGAGTESSIAHPYGAGPAYILHEYVLGVRPLTSDWSRILVRPRSIGLWQTSGRVPSPRGPIEISWARTDRSWSLELVLPSGVIAEVELPRLGIEAATLEVDGVIAGRVEVWDEFFALAMRQEGAVRTTTLRCTVTGATRHRVTLAAGNC